MRIVALFTNIRGAILTEQLFHQVLLFQERQEKQQKHKISQLLKFNQHGAENTWNTYFPINSKSHHTHGGIRTPED